MDPAHRGSRRLYPSAIPLELCQELLFIQRALAVVGYRPCVTSLTLYELLLACPQLLPPVAKARQLIWDAVEAQFDLYGSIWPETTSLISWTAGASIGWHWDSNQPYLAGRHFSAVAYLNSQGCSFEGGTFCFQSGSEPRQVAPQAGMLLVYTADNSNVHSVQEVASGERSTLTMWFTLDPEQREDRKVLSKLQSSQAQSTSLPQTMYEAAAGVDIRVARLQQRLGLTVRPAAPQQQQEQHQQTGPQGATAQPRHEEQPPAGQLHEAQQQVLVQCCAAQCDGHCVGESVFQSVQEAVTACCMLEWDTAGSCPTQLLTHDCAEAHTADCQSCMLVAKLPAAALRVQQHLARASEVYARCLPGWHQLDALVPPE